MDEIIDDAESLIEEAIETNCPGSESEARMSDHIREFINKGIRAQKAVDEVIETQRRASLAKPQRVELPEYLKFVRRHACIVAKCWKPTQAHHIVFDGQGRIGSKVADTQAVPCCEKHHAQYHAIGRVQFELRYGLNFYQIIIDSLTEYLVERPPASGSNPPTPPGTK